MPTTVFTGEFDVDNITRTGGLTNATDSGTAAEFGCDIVGSVSVNQVVPINVASGTFDAITRVLGTYRIDGDVDFAGAALPVPANAKITRITMRAGIRSSASIASNINTTVASGVPLVSAQGTVSTSGQDTGVGRFLRAPNAVDNPTTVVVTPYPFGTVENINNVATPGNLSLGSSFATGLPAPTYSVEWDYTVIMPGGVPYLTQPDLLTQFTAVRIGSTLSWINSSSLFFQSGGVANGAGTVDADLEFEVTQWRMEVEWHTEFQLDYGSSPASGSIVEVGQEIRITSDGIDFASDLFLDLVTININGTPVVPSFQSRTLFIFYIDASFSGLALSITATPVNSADPGMQFSGSIDLIGLIVLTANASGIYTLVRGKTSDTLYSSLRDGTTFDTKIPDPMFKTGFIGG